MKSLRSLCLSFIACVLPFISTYADPFLTPPENTSYTLIYFDDLTKAPHPTEWIMEGPGLIGYSHHGMNMRSLFYDTWLVEWMAMPEEERLSLGNAGINAMMYDIALVMDPVHAEEAMTDKGFKGGHQVFWLNHWLPENILIEYEFLNVSPAGLYINFFSANAYGRSIFAPDLAPRNGVFEQYTDGDFKSYHTSFGARFDGNVRGSAHIRVNPGENPVAEGKDIVAQQPYEPHKIQIIKHKNDVKLFVDGKEYVSYRRGKPERGYFGLRQMSTSNALYKNLRIYEIKDTEPQANSAPQR